KTKGITWVVVGADCIAANGDMASKIGTYQLAVSAMHHGVRFMVVAPSTSIDLNLATGEDIPLEERDADEWLDFGGAPAVRDVQVFNP
ncbi:S-methyl-5-thioribose-1-phosphate isomerase, partial [Pseudomonas sp. SIMBA_059]